MTYLRFSRNLFLYKISVSLITVFLLLGCATPYHKSHAFAFAMYRDNQDTEVLDYWYDKNASHAMVAESEWRKEKGIPKQGESIFGLTKRGDYLYVKWRNLTTKKIYEDLVDLRHRLPEDLAMSTIFFMVKKEQLMIYVVSDISKGPSESSNGPSLYRARKTKLIYPD